VLTRPAHRDVSNGHDEYASLKQTTYVVDIPGLELILSAQRSSTIWNP